MKHHERRHFLAFGTLVFMTFLTLMYYLSRKNITHEPQNWQEIKSSFPHEKEEERESPVGAVIETDVAGALNITDLSNTTLSFILKLLEHGINAFIIEPCILWKVISEKDRDLLTKRASVPQFATQCYPIKAHGPPFITLGVMDFDSTNMGSNILKQLLERDEWEVEEFWNPKNGKLSHHMARKESQIIHTVTFYQRNKFLITQELSTPAFEVPVKELRFGATRQAFEPIILEYYVVNGAKVLFPKNIRQVLFEMPHSQFLECRHDLAAKHNKKYRLKGEPLNQLQETITVMRKITYKVLMPIWLDGGSLIGWARHCGAIPYELDADFASWGHIHRNSWELAEEIVKSVDPPWYFIETFGLPWAGYELRLYHTKLDWQVDFFFTTQDEEDNTQSYLGYHTFPGVYFYKLYYNSSIFSTVCSGEILGQKIMVPCHYNELLTEEYGPEWITPDEHHFLKYQPRQHRTYWPEEEGFYAYQCLGRDQFSIRKYDYSKYKYTTDREKTPANLSEPFGNVINEYKSVCTRLRWDRTS